MTLVIQVGRTDAGEINNGQGQTRISGTRAGMHILRWTCTARVTAAEAMRSLRGRAGRLIGSPRATYLSILSAGAAVPRAADHENPAVAQRGSGLRSRALFSARRPNALAGLVSRASIGRRCRHGSCRAMRGKQETGMLHDSGTDQTSDPGKRPASKAPVRANSEGLRAQGQSQCWGAGAVRA